MSLHVPEMYRRPLPAGESLSTVLPVYKASKSQARGIYSDGCLSSLSMPSLFVSPDPATKVSGHKKAVECHHGGLCGLMLAAVGIGVLEMVVVVDRLVDKVPSQDENADYVAGDRGIAQDGGDANMGPKEAVPVAEVRSQW